MQSKLALTTQFLALLTLTLCVVANSLYNSDEYGIIQQAALRNNIHNLAEGWRQTALQVGHTAYECLSPKVIVTRGLKSAVKCFINYKNSGPFTRHGGALGERKYSSYSFLTSALEGGEWSASRPRSALPPEKEPPGTHCTGGWVGPRAGLFAEVRGKILCLSGIKPRPSSP
jgi:hypothetical protein